MFFRLIIYLLSICLLHCWAFAADPTLDQKQLVIGTGAVGGVYRDIGAALCRFINADNKGVGTHCITQNSAGSLANVRGLERGLFDIALIQSDVQDASFRGTNIDGTKNTYGEDMINMPTTPFSNMRSILTLYEESAMVLVRRDSNIKSLQDLVGKSISIGTKRSSYRIAMYSIMLAKGWKNHTFKSVYQLQDHEHVTALCDSKIDALAIMVGHPNILIGELLNSCDLRALNINDAQIKTFVKNNPQYYMTKISSDLYQDLDEDVDTFGTKAMLVTTTYITPGVVTSLLQSIFSHFEDFKQQSPVLKDLTPESMAKVNSITPLHEEAAEYYKTKGLSIK